LTAQDPVYARKFQEHDIRLGMQLDTSDAKFEESKAEIKNIILEKVRLEGELQLKLAGTFAPN